MTTPISINFVESDIDTIATLTGKVAVLVSPDGKIDTLARRVNRLSKGAIARFAESDAFAKLENGAGVALAYPAGMDCEGVMVVKLPKRPSVIEARKAGATMAIYKGTGVLTVLAASSPKAADISYGLALRAYAFIAHKTTETDEIQGATMMVTSPESIAAEAGPMAALAEGV
ncbi:MAG: leucyl aminopeptidase, partial [Alphaproteobacteria bacterium]